jgi:8-oxo-dGTP pyrophosphatase MutT (NUDIX family)
MWMMTPFGFFSVVQKAGTKNLTVRARVGSDLDRLRELYLPGLSATKTTPNNDYRYRAIVSHQELAVAMSRIVADITYDNFKSEVGRAQGHDRAHVYSDVWSVLNRGLPPLDKQAPTEAVPRAAKYGGVVFDQDGLVLLREPTNHFDNYVWTFAKGAPDGHETPQQTAIREVREETGVEAEIIGLVPGVFAGGTGTTVYFMMRCLAEQPLGSKAKRETAQIRWVSEHEAKELIAETTNAKGRKRDLAVLAAAYKAWRTLR